VNSFFINNKIIFHNIRYFFSRVLSIKIRLRALLFLLPLMLFFLFDCSSCIFHGFLLNFNLSYFNVFYPSNVWMEKGFDSWIFVSAIHRKMGLIWRRFLCRLRGESVESALICFTVWCLRDESELEWRTRQKLH
jgi:hypothetical protein